MAKPFRVVVAAPEMDPDQLVECSGCGHQFWISPFEDVVWSRRRGTLVALCPKCGAVDDGAEGADEKSAADAPGANLNNNGGEEDDHGKPDQ